MGGTEYVFVGGSTAGARKGISIFRFDEKTRALERLGDVDGIVNPTYLTVDPNRRLLYACSESADKGALVTFRFDAGKVTLTKIGSEPTHGAYPCFSLISRDGKHLLVANYGATGANPNKAVAIFRLDQNGLPLANAATFELVGTGPNKDRQERSHPHSIMETATDSVFAVADLGTDLLTLFEVSARGQPTVFSTAAMPAGSGPRHAKLHPEGNFTLVNGELNSTIICLDQDLVPVDAQSTLPFGAKVDNTTAEVCIAPDGRAVYVSNRGHDSIAVFAFDPSNGALTSRGHIPSGGATPRHFTLTASGRYLIAANQGSDNLAIFARDVATGELSDTDISVADAAPSCAKTAVFG